MIVVAQVLATAALHSSSMSHTCAAYAATKRSSETHRPRDIPQQSSHNTCRLSDESRLLLHFGCSREAVRFPALLLLHSTHSAYITMQRHIRGTA
jgi:hypothetical protein